MTSYCFECRDAGLDCSFSTEADSMEELLQKISEHAAREHGFRKLPAYIRQKVTDAIKIKLLS